MTEQPISFHDSEPASDAENEGRAAHVDAVDSIADGSERSPDPRSVTAARISSAIFLVVVGAPSTIGMAIWLVLASQPPLARLLAPLGWSMFLVGFGTWLLIWPGIRHRHVSYRVDDHGLRIRRVGSDVHVFGRISRPGAASDR